MPLMRPGSAYLSQQLPALSGRCPVRAQPLAGLRLSMPVAGAGLCRSRWRGLGAQVTGHRRLGTQRDGGAAPRRASGAAVTLPACAPGGSADEEGTFDIVLAPGRCGACGGRRRVSAGGGAAGEAWRPLGHRDAQSHAAVLCEGHRPARNTCCAGCRGARTTGRNSCVRRGQGAFDTAWIRLRRHQSVSLIPSRSAGLWGTISASITSRFSHAPREAQCPMTISSAAGAKA